ncbi:putative ankyrin repeat protein RF_0381 [Haliotis cracherodii]|uniref:putative ankyrin repeat protein RF_0381 n=1 Tax=Haliotis cracherodii TaxID=6455 RepID=UPI0039E76822
MSEQDDDNTPPESGARNIHVAPKMGQNACAKEVFNVGVVYGGVKQTVNQQGDDERLRDDLRKLRSKLTVWEREKCDKQAVVQDLKSKTNNLEKEVQQLKQQACAKAVDIQNMEKKIGKLMEDVKPHTDEIENLENNIIPDLKKQIRTVEIRLVLLRETVEDTTNAIPDLEKRMEGLKMDLEKYGGEIKSERESVAELCILIEHLKKDILDQKKEQETMAARVQKIETDELHIKAEMAKQTSDERREREELQRQTQKQHEEMTEMKAKLEQQLNDEREAAEGKIQELNKRDAMQVKRIQDLMEQTQQASSDPSKNPGQIEGVSPIQLTQQETDLHATSSPADCGDLYDASEAGHLEEVKRLLSLGVDVNCKGLRGRTPVMVAAYSGHRDVVELLVSQGADVSLVDEVDNDILHLACVGGDLETVEFVLSLNLVDINSRGERSRTPVMRAALGGHRDVVELLVSEGANVSLVDEDGDNIVHLACVGGDLETVKFVLVLNVVDINRRGLGSRTPVMWAAVWGHRDVVELLVSEGANVSLVDEDGDNILHLACVGGDLETVEFVLSLNLLDINSREERSKTPVMWAALGGHRDVVELLVSEGANVSLVDEDGDNILHLASSEGHMETVKFVLSLNVVDIDARDNSGQTAADLARRGGRHLVADLFVSSSAQ